MLVFYLTKIDYQIIRFKKKLLFPTFKNQYKNNYLRNILLKISLSNIFSGLDCFIKHIRSVSNRTKNFKFKDEESNSIRYTT